MVSTEKRFNAIIEEIAEAVEHIPDAVSGSEIDSDLGFIADKVVEAQKLRELM